MNNPALYQVAMNLLKQNPQSLEIKAPVLKQAVLYIRKVISADSEVRDPDEKLLMPALDAYYEALEPEVLLVDVRLKYQLALDIEQYMQSSQDASWDMFLATSIVNYVEASYRHWSYYYTQAGGFD